MLGWRSKMLAAVLVTVFWAGPSALDADSITPSSSVSKPVAPYDAADLAGHGHFIMALCQDLQGRIWIGDEDEGIYRYDPSQSSGSRWAHFTAADGLGGNCVYALCCDKLGRIWAGTLNSGVSVYNGQAWKTYDPLAGPLGCHVTALAASPVDGDVWMASESGVTRYSACLDRWIYYTRKDGLASDAISALVFDHTGNLYVGTQCDGISIGSAQSGFRSWRTIAAPANLAATQTGSGLPCNLINALLVASDGSVFAGTDCGLAKSTDGGANWTFVRGANWQDNLAGQGVSSTDEAMVSGIEVIQMDSASSAHLAICCGNSKVDPASADQDFVGGQAYSTRAKIATDGVANAGPPFVYQSCRHGKSFKYVISGLSPNTVYTLRLHFAETAFDEPGKRLFSVTVNGAKMLDGFDVFGAAGAKNTAVVRDMSLTTDASGSIEIDFKGERRIPGYEPSGPLLSEEYVTSLAEDGNGGIWVGHRKSGIEKIDGSTFATVESPDTGALDYASTLLAAQGGPLLVGWYSAGLTSMDAKPVPHPDQVTATGDAPFPSLALAPDLTELNLMLADIAKVPVVASPDNVPLLAQLDDDWTTQGSWLGRYGRYWACLCAICSPYDYIWGAGWDKVRYFSRIGPNAKPNDSLRYWVQWLYSDNPRVLELPPVYLDSRIKKGLTTAKMGHREAEADDHGEGYAWYVNGPSVYFTLTVPKGLFYLSVYDFNKDGTGGDNRVRDYKVSVREHPGGAALSDISSFDRQPELAHARIVNFRGGVWKRFLVRGPIDLTVEIDKNHLFNTILPAVMLDLVDEQPPPYFETVQQWTDQRKGAIEAEQKQIISLRTTELSAFGLQAADTEAEAATRLFGQLEALRDTNPAWWAENKQAYYLPLLRWYAKQNGGVAPTATTSSKLALKLGTCCYELGMYENWEACQTAGGLHTAREIEKALQWDGIHGSGDGYEIVSRYLKGVSVSSASLGSKSQPKRSQE